MMNKTTMLIVAAGTLFLPLSGAFAQPKADAPPMPPPGAAQLQPIKPVPALPHVAPVSKPAPTFSDEEFKAIAAKLSGCWKTAEPIGGGDLVIGIAPVAIRGMTDTLYSEVCRGDALNRPFRQTIWQLHRVKGAVRVKTYEFRRSNGAMESIFGMWTCPDLFPAIGAEDLVATMDIELTKDGSGYKGHTLSPYPTSIGGAVEMTSNIAFDGNTFSVNDQGQDASGKVVWGPPTPAGYAFKRFDAAPKVSRLDGGVAVIDYPALLQGEAAQPGSRVSIQYMAYLEDGKMFDSSFERGTPFSYMRGEKLIDGWNIAMNDARKGMTRRVILPAAMAHAERTDDGKIPANSTLIYDVRVMDVTAPGQAATPAPGAPVISGLPVGANLQPVDPNDPAVQKMQADMKARMDAKRKKAEEAKPGSGVLAPKDPPK